MCHSVQLSLRLVTSALLQGANGRGAKAQRVGHVMIALLLHEQHLRLTFVKCLFSATAFAPLTTKKVCVPKHMTS